MTQNMCEGMMQHVIQKGNNMIQCDVAVQCYVT